LEAAGIGCGVHYQLPVHLQPAYRQLGYAPGSLPVSEAVAARCLSVPMFPDLSEAQVDEVAAVVRAHAKAGG
ncbi:MAG: DegT/DnrJ/EryC1/StrS family aminotransferase, partial [Deltaproteobacteria bacterium]|nr:DegT/DnrJ/EryC1/StrS family aminotransferase [Deltaproteobacteria bacterium]